MNHSELTEAAQTGLGIYFFCCLLLNLGFVVYFWKVRRDLRQTSFWSLAALVFLVHAAIFLMHKGSVIPAGIREAIDAVMNPTTYFLLACAGFILLLRYRAFFTEPTVALALLNISLLFSGW